MNCAAVAFPSGKDGSLTGTVPHRSGRNRAKDIFELLSADGGLRSWCHSSGTASSNGKLAEFPVYL
jgi:hypothetical protein